MKVLITCMLALFFLATTCGYAQVPISGTPIGEKISTTVKTYTLSAALPLAKSLVGQKIVVTGNATAVTIASKTPVWFILVDGMAKVSVVNKIGAVTTANPIGQKVAVIGSFAVNSITQAMEFLATGVTIISSTDTDQPITSGGTDTDQQISSSGTVIGEAVPSTAKVMTLSTALPMAKTLLGQKFVVTGTASTLAVSLKVTSWITLVDGTAKVPVIQKIAASVVKPANGAPVKLYGFFEYNNTISAMQFVAVSLIK